MFGVIYLPVFGSSNQIACSTCFATLAEAYAFIAAQSIPSQYIVAASFMLPSGSPSSPLAPYQFTDDDTLVLYLGGNLTGGIKGILYGNALTAVQAAGFIAGTLNPSNYAIVQANSI